MPNANSNQPIRKRLPNRRTSVSFSFEISGLRYSCTFSRFASSNRSPSYSCKTLSHHPNRT